MKDLHKDEINTLQVEAEFDSWHLEMMELHEKELAAQEELKREGGR